MTNQPTDNDDASVELFSTIAVLIDEHSLTEVLQEISIYCDMKSEDPDNCGHCQALAAFSTLEIDQLIERMEHIDGLLSGGRCDGPANSDN